jgi:lambda family phage tail tape measure protein
MTLTYKATVDSSQAEKSLNNLSKSVDGLNQNFVKLRDRIATISLTAIISQAIKFADTVQDLADATDLSTASIIGFGNAVAQNGGSVDGAQKGIAKLIAEIDDAANSAGASREAFKDVGVSLEDLRTKSTQAIFNDVIKGLAGIDDSATKSRLAAILLNKEMRGVNFKGVGTDFGGNTASAEKYASATKAAAAANDKLAAAVATFQLKLVAALEPINKFIASIDPKSIEIFADRLIKVGTAFAGLFVIGKVATLIQSFIAMTRGAAAGTLSMAASAGGAAAIFPMFALGLKQMGQAFNISTAATVASYTGFSTLGIMVKSFFGGLLRMIPVIGTVILAFQVLDGILESLTGKNIWEWAQQAAKGLGLIKQTSGEADKAAADHLANMKEIEAENQKVRDAVVRGQEAMAKFRGEVAKANLESKQNLQIQGQALSNLGFRLAHERSLIGLSEDEKELSNQLYDLDVQRFDKQDEYARAVKKLQQERSLTKDEEANKLLGARIGILKAEAEESDAQALRHKQGITDQLKDLQKTRLIENDRLQTQQNIVKSIEDQISRQQALGDIIKGINDKRVDLNFQSTMKGKSPLEQQILDIKESARKAALEAGRAFSQGFNDEDGITAEKAKELTNGLNEIANAYKGIADAQIAALGVSQEFAAGQLEGIAAIQEQIKVGLTSAWDEYKTKALDTAGQIKSSFENFTSGLEDAFVSFVQTGKLSFKDLANSILADLARIAFKKAVLGMVGLFGLAAGGSAMAGTPYMVGERGPELFIPQTAGKVIPNNVLNGSAGGQGAVNGGGQTMVTYNIQAVDASSFRSMVARDPSFIYAVTEQGRRSQPTRSR